MRIRPLGTKVLVELDPLSTMSTGGIHLPETATYYHMNRPDARWGTVKAAGPRCRLGLKPGDSVCINAWLTDSTKHGTPGGKKPVDGEVLVDETDVFMVATDTLEEARAFVAAKLEKLR